MRILPLCAASALSLAAGARVRSERPSADDCSVEVILNATPNAPAAAGSPVAEPPILFADSVDSVTIVVAIRDAAGRPIADLPVRIDVTGSRNILTPAAASLTDVNGVLVANLTTTTAETKTISVVANPGPEQVVLADQPPVTFTAGPATYFDLTVGPEAGGGRRDVTVTARDFFDNVVGIVHSEH